MYTVIFPHIINNGTYECIKQVCFENTHIVRGSPLTESMQPGIANDGNFSVAFGLSDMHNVSPRYRQNVKS